MGAANKVVKTTGSAARAASEIVWNGTLPESLAKATALCTGGQGVGNAGLSRSETRQDYASLSS